MSISFQLNTKFIIKLYTFCFAIFDMHFIDKKIIEIKYSYLIKIVEKFKNDRIIFTLKYKINLKSIIFILEELREA